MAPKNPRLSVSGSLLVDRGANSNVETQSSGGSGAGSAYDDGGYSAESAAGEGEQNWEEGGEDLDSDDEEVNVSWTLLRPNDKCGTRGTWYLFIEDVHAITETLLNRFLCHAP